VNTAFATPQPLILQIQSIAIEGKFAFGLHFPLSPCLREISQKSMNFLMTWLLLVRYLIPLWAETYHSHKRENKRNSQEFATLI
jgi:hypothetical protein